MTKTHFENVGQVVSWRLCMGCGACVTACPDKNIKLFDVMDQGLRPVVNLTKCQKCGECVKVCPGIGLEHHPFDKEIIPELRQSWGPVLELWEGYASDPEIRFKSSSGGIATALAFYCIERENVAGVLHIAADHANPLKNRTVFSKNREDLLKACGSRYAPASPCDGFKWIEKADGKCVFIGKPCDVVALRKAQLINPVLDDKIAVAISIFCAGTPTSDGTYKILEKVGAKADQISKFRYRGCGWPGMTTILDKNGQAYEMTYEQSWGEILSKHGQLRCHLCPDSTGEFADISCGDPWYREIESYEPGRSLVLARTKHGQRILHRAMEAGYIELERVQPAVLAASQKALLNKRQNLFGRLFSMAVFAIPIPYCKGFSLYRNWLQLPLMGKFYSIVGTFKRIIMRGWLRPLNLHHVGAGNVSSSTENNMSFLDV